MTHAVCAIVLPSPTVLVSPKMEGLYWLYIGFSDIFHMLFQIRFFRFTRLLFPTSPLDLEPFHHYLQHSSYSTLSYLTLCTSRLVYFLTLRHQSPIHTTPRSLLLADFYSIHLFLSLLLLTSLHIYMCHMSSCAAYKYLCIWPIKGQAIVAPSSLPSLCVLSLCNDCEPAVLQPSF